MKLRLNDVSVRLRLRRSEVQIFADTGSVSTEAIFPGGRRLLFRLVSSQVDKAAVSYSGDSIEVLVPAETGERWSHSDEVGIYGQHGGMDIAIEKDFRRTTLPSPDDGDRYPNPRSPGSALRETR